MFKLNSHQIFIETVSRQIIGPAEALTKFIDYICEVVKSDDEEDDKEYGLGLLHVKPEVWLTYMVIDGSHIAVHIFCHLYPTQPLLSMEIYHINSSISIMKIGTNTECSSVLNRDSQNLSRFLERAILELLQANNLMKRYNVEKIHQHEYSWIRTLIIP